MSKGSKKSKRSRFWFIEGKCIRRLQQFVDFDYIDQLSDDEKQFLQDFAMSYYNADIQAFIKHMGREPNAEEKKEIYLRSNAWQRDGFNQWWRKDEMYETDLAVGKESTIAEIDPLEYLILMEELENEEKD